MTPLGPPCEQVELLTTGKIGAHVSFLANSLLPDAVELELFKHGTTRKRGSGAEIVRFSSSLPGAVPGPGSKGLVGIESSKTRAINRVIIRCVALILAPPTSGYFGTLHGSVLLSLRDRPTNMANPQTYPQKGALL